MSFPFIAKKWVGIMHDRFVVRVGALVLSVFVFSATSRAADWSPSGKTLTFWADWAGNLEAYIINVDGTGLKNLTNHPAEDANPVWSPDGRKIAFYSKRGGNGGEIYVMGATSWVPGACTRR